MDGSLIGLQEYTVWVLPTWAHPDVEYGDVVANLEVYRRPSSGGYGWAWYYTVPIRYDEYGSTCICCLCPCGNGEYEVSFEYRSCSEEQSGYDYNFRITPADDDQGFGFHAGVAYLNYSM